MTRDPLKVAQGELGNTENPAGSNRTKYGKWMGLDGQPWCMSFVQWCFNQAGYTLPYKTGSCSALLSWYRKNKPECIVTAPKAGDIVIYNFGHTGILESTAAGAVTVVEGNTSAGAAGSQNNGGGVFTRTRSRTLVQAFIRPFDKYSEAPQSGALGVRPAEGGPAEEDIMTGEEIYNELNNYLKKQPVPGWAKAELEEAVKLGITDGKEPMALIPRYQAAIMAKRAREDR